MKYSALLLIIPFVLCSCNNSHEHTEGEKKVENVVEATCFEDGSYDLISRCLECGEIISSEHIVVDALKHNFGTPVYEWNEDYSKCTATRVCKNDSTHVETETVDSTFEVTRKVSSTVDGEEVYTATFQNEGFETQNKVFTISHQLMLDKLSFTLIDNYYGVTIKKDVNNIVDIDIPREYNGLPVCEFTKCNETKIESIVIPDTIKVIKQNAFRDCKKIKEIKLPQGLEIIEDYAFDYCEALETIDIPSGIKKLNSLFSGCKSLKTVNLHEGLETIDQAFWNCGDSLVSLLIPESVSVISRGSFYNCGNLTVYAKSETQKPGWSGESGLLGAFVLGVDKYYTDNNTQYVIKNDEIIITGISNSDVKNVFIPSSIEGKKVISIHDRAFAYKKGIETVEISEGVKSVGEYGFLFSENITEIKLANSIKTLGYGTFRGCAKLNKINIPYNLEVIPTLCFCETAIEYIQISENIKRIEVGAFEDSKLIFLYIPNNVEIIEKEAFGGCDDLTLYVPWKNIPSGFYFNWSLNFYGELVREVNAIAYHDDVIYVFSNSLKYWLLGYCKNKEIKSLNIYDEFEVKRISKCAFKDCVNLEEIYITDSVYNIGENAFLNCPSLTIHFQGDAIPNGDWNPDNRPIICDLDIS